MDANHEEGHRARQDAVGANGSLLAPAEILEGLPDAVVAAADDGRIVFVNALAEELFGYPREELLGEPVQVLWPERLRDRYTRNMRLYFATEHRMRFSIEAWGLRRDGSEFPGEMSWGIVRTTAGPLLLAIGRDVSERHAAETRLQALAAMAERALAGIESTELAHEAVDAIRSALPVAGAEVRVPAGGALATYGSIGRASIDLPLDEGAELLVAPDRELDEEELDLVRAVAKILDTALARLRDEEQMRHDAVHDPLTGLANRTLLRDHLEHALARSERRGDATGVLFVDLDRFKQINDAYGHAVGDAVLMEVGDRLRTAVRPGDTIARLGGDEFVIVCEGIDERSAVAIGQRLRDAIKLPLKAGGMQHRLSASIGIALGGGDPDDLIGRADAAAYRAKASGRGGLEVFH